MFIPIVRSLFGAYACPDSMPDAPDVENCYENEHWIYMAFSAMCLFVFIPLCVRLAIVDGALGRICVYYFKNWTQDKPDISRIHGMSRSDMKLNQVMLMVCSYNFKSS